MATAVSLRTDMTAAELRRLAAASKNANLSLAAVRDGMNRTEAARIGGMDRQTLRDWVHRFNALGPAGLLDARPKTERSRRLTAAQLAELAQAVETGPDLATYGVVRWRRIDLKHLIEERFGVVYHERTIGKLVSLRRGPQVGSLRLRGSEERRVGFVDFDEFDEGLDSEVGERHDGVVTGAVDPDDAVLDVHFVGDLVQPIFVFAEVLGDAGDGGDAGDLVDVHAHAARAESAEDRGAQFLAIGESTASVLPAARRRAVPSMSAMAKNGRRARIPQAWDQQAASRIGPGVRPAR